MLEHQLDEARKQVLVISALLNSLVAVNRIPLELLVKIMLHVQADCADPSGWLHFLLVCRHWFVVASTTPGLWTDLWVHTRFNYLLTGFMRSKTHPVDVSALSSNTVPALLEVTTPHTYRLRRLRLNEITFEHYDSVVSPFLGASSMPALQALHLTRAHITNVPQEPVILLPSERYPRLKDLNLSSVQLSPTSSIFPQLTRLVLDRWRSIDPPLYVNALIGMLRLCVNLKMLVIKKVAAKTVPDQASDSRPPVHLPRMRDFVVDATPEVIKRILSTFSFPPTACISVVWEIFPTNNWTDTVLQGMRSVLPTNRASLPILQHVTELDFTSTASQQVFIATAPIPRGWSPDAQPPRISLSMEVTKIPPRVGDPITFVPLEMQDFFDIFGHAPLRSLTMQCAGGIQVMMMAAWDQLYERFPDLHTLGARATPGEKPGVAGTLFNPVIRPLVPGGIVISDRVVCPNLKHFRVVGFAEMTESLLRCFLRLSPPDMKERLPSLELLTFEGADGECLEDFEEMRNKYVEQLSGVFSEVRFIEKS